MAFGWRRQKDLNLRGELPRLRAFQARPFGRSGMPPEGAMVPDAARWTRAASRMAEAVRFERTRGVNP